MLREVFRAKELPLYCSFARFELSSSHFDREEMSSWLMHFPVIVECLVWRTMDFKAMYGDFGRWLVDFIYRVNTRLEK